MGLAGQIISASARRESSAFDDLILLSSTRQFVMSAKPMMCVALLSLSRFPEQEFMCAAQPPVYHGVWYLEKPESLAAATADQMTGKQLFREAGTFASLSQLPCGRCRNTAVWCGRNGVFPTLVDNKVINSSSSGRNSGSGNEVVL